MNKLFIGLLIVAIGAGAFFYLRKKDKPTGNDIKKEWIVGKWKIDSLTSGKGSSDNFLVGIMGLVDPNTLKYHYEFTKNGAILRSLNDSLTKDSSRYEWDKEDQLIWKEDPADSTGSVLLVAKLNKDSLLLQNKDSTTILFTKVK